MFDKLLGIGTTFDWISPLIAAIRDMANGPSFTFFIERSSAWSGKEMADLLKRHGIKSWGHMIVNDKIMLTVRKKQAHWAQYLLLREGVPIENGLSEESSHHACRRTEQVPVHAPRRRRVDETAQRATTEKKNSSPIKLLDDLGEKLDSFWEP